MFVSTHSCLFHSSPQNPHYPVETPPTLLPTVWSASASISLTNSSFQTNLQKDIANIKHEWESVWEVFPELSKNPIREPERIPPSSSSTSHTNISSTSHHTLSSIACTTNSHTHSHTKDHLLQTNTTTPTTTSITTLAPIIFPKQPRLEKTKKSARTISAISTTTTSATTSITMSAPTIFPKKSCSTTTKQSTHITFPMRHTPTLSPLISTDTRLKCHKKSPLLFAQHRTSLTTHPTTSSTSSTTSTIKIPPNTKISTTPVQSASTSPIHNTPTTITNNTTLTATIYTTTPTTTINTTTNATQTQIPSLMGFNNSLSPRLRTPSTSLTIP